MVSIIGPMVDNGDVELAALSTIGYWIDMYLGMKERAKGWPVGQLARPNSYIQTYDPENWPEGQTPAIVAVCHGTVGEPLRYGNGVGAWFELDIDSIVVGQTEAEARNIAAAYASTVATMLEQQSQLMGEGDTPFSTDCPFQGWKLELPDEENRTLAVATATFHVKVDQIFNQYQAPLAPPVPSAEDPGDEPTADTINFSLTEHPTAGDVTNSEDPGEHTDSFSSTS
jgi:hypothetical protein